ncbi:DUF7560 family zinc ribbon protein [Salinilacihabitans rarus]|uniref:DUF7560 family zinc ribbon protein n=1 Tax=Salinilacihabitans rarus TaxID=2961596 RepID=UPI003CCE0ADD
MSGKAGTETMFRFTCPACEMSPIVDAVIRADMLANGCYLCGTQVSESAFREVCEE